MAPGSVSALFHRHALQDEFVVVLSGELTLIHDDGETVLRAGMCVGFRRQGTAYQLVNRSDREAAYLEVGDRRPGDSASYPRDDLVAVRTDSGWSYAHEDGSPY